MKWLFTLVYMNTGLLLLCFGQMAHVNRCDRPMETSFFVGGMGFLAMSLCIAIVLVARRRHAQTSW
jgi:hypothetical protein